MRRYDSLVIKATEDNYPLEEDKSLQNKQGLYDKIGLLPPPRLVRKGGELRGIYHFSYCHCYGWCNLPLHHQMVGR